MNREQMLEKLASYGILAQDLRLFLDVNPKHGQALRDYKRIVAEYNQLIHQYEQHYGPLLGAHDQAGNWTDKPWPWHREGGQ